MVVQISPDAAISLMNRSHLERASKRTPKRASKQPPRRDPQPRIPPVYESRRIILDAPLKTGPVSTLALQWAPVIDLSRGASRTAQPAACRTDGKPVCGFKPFLVPGPLGSSGCTVVNGTVTPSAFSQPASAFSQSASAFSQPASAFSQPASAFSQPASVSTALALIHTPSTALIPYVTPTVAHCKRYGRHISRSALTQSLVVTGLHIAGSTLLLVGTTVAVSYIANQDHGCGYGLAHCASPNATGNTSTAVADASVEFGNWCRSPVWQQDNAATLEPFLSQPAYTLLKALEAKNQQVYTSPKLGY